MASGVEAGLHSSAVGGPLVRRTATLTGALAELPSDYRLIVQLRYFDGLSLEETADVVGKTTGAVRGVLDRAKQKIRESLQSASRYLSR